MGEITLKSKMKSGDVITGKVDSISTDTNTITFEMKDESLLKVGGFPDNIIELIDDDYEGSIIRITKTDSGDFTVKELDDFPDEEKKK